MKELQEMSIEELKELINNARKILLEKQRAVAKEFEFEFSATNDPRKGKPYVARLYWDGKLQREFFDLMQQYGKKEVTVMGKYTAKVGDIIEKRFGGSWRNDYRNWYFITEDGQEIHVASINDSRAKAKVQQYLKGEISADELINKEEP